jgi:hypothetical protein
MAATIACVFRGNWTAIPEQTDQAVLGLVISCRSEATRVIDYALD